VFTAEERDATRTRLLTRAASDPAIAGAAITGSEAVGAGDEWSDIDLALAVEGPLEPTLDRWTTHLYADFAAVHHWDLPSGASTYRVFLLPSALEVDIAFTPAAEWGPHGPTWRTVFGQPAPRPPGAPPQSRRDLTGRAWHHALHARVCIHRRRWWQAEHWIGALRTQILTLAALRLGHPAAYAKGAHLLPPEVTGPLTASLVRTLDEPELTRALTAATAALLTELTHLDEPLAERLTPILSPAPPPA